MNADLYALAERIDRLNPDAGEIGDGMLRSLVTDARRCLERRKFSESTTPPSAR